MALVRGKFSYQRLKHEPPLDDQDGGGGGGVGFWNLKELQKRIGSARRSRIRKVHIRKKLRVKIPSLKRLLRRKTRVLMVACRKLMKRLKESQSHFGDLFAGNYLFMQVTPTPVNWPDKSLKSLEAGHGGLSSSTATYSLPRPRLV